MNETGWIKLNRKILDWRWYHDENTFRVFLHLLLIANVKDGGYLSDTIHRGEVVVTIGNIAKALKITYNQTRKALEHLKETNEITTTSRSKYLIVSILNYDKYQDNHTQSTTKAQPSHNQSTTTSQVLSNNIRNKEDKNIYIYDEGVKQDFGGVFLTDDEWDELRGYVNDDGAFIDIIDRVGDWLADNPRPKEKHKSIVKTFLRNDGWI